MPNYNEALRYEIFVKEEYACAKQAIQQADLIFDIGGHLGYFSQWCRKIGSEAEIHYFEPLPFLYEEAKERLKADPKITFHNFWIGARDEEISFFINEEKSMQSSRYESFLNKNGKEVKVEMRKFDLTTPPPYGHLPWQGGKLYGNEQEGNVQFTPLSGGEGGGRTERSGSEDDGRGGCKQLAQPKILVKLDIEGMEYEVLESRSDDIRNNIWTLLLEVHFLKNGDKERYKKLKNSLQQHFWSIQEQISTYTENIRLIYAKK